MNKMICALLFVALSGCATGPTQTPAKLAAVVCPAVKTELDMLTLTGMFTGGAADTLKRSQPDIDAVCAVGATVDTVSLQKLVDVTFPLLGTLVKNSTLSADEKTRSYVVISSLQLLINTNIALISK